MSTVAEQVLDRALGAINPTRDEFVPVTEVQQVLQRAKEPKKLWIVRAANQPVHATTWGSSTGVYSKPSPGYPQSVK